MYHYLIGAQMKLYTRQLPAPPDSMYIGEAYAWKRRGKVALRCVIDGDNVYCLEDPRLVTALIELEVPIEIIAVSKDAYVEWDDPIRYRRAKIAKLIRSYGTPDNPKGNVYEISNRRETGKVYCKFMRQLNSTSTIIL
jgi:hypothetical protein